jgi:hypothetical protein
MLETLIDETTTTIFETYLDFTVTEEADGGLVTHAPEVSLGKVQRVIELDDGVGLLGDGLQVSLGGTNCRLAADGLRNRGESRGAGSDGGEKESRLHFSFGTQTNTSKQAKGRLVLNNI